MARYRVYILIGIAFLIISGATAYLHQNSDTVNKTDVSGTACSQAPNYDINKGTQAWLLEKLELPEPHATQAALAVNDPQRFEDVLRGYFLKCPVLKGLPMDENINSVRNYRNGILKLGPNPVVPFKLPLDWKRICI